ncbi:MAG: phosphomannomutase/phosphoglucomutase, partial [Burkholderiales bacterium]
MSTLAPEIFKAYDIRGVVDQTLTVEGVRRIGQALGSLAVERGRQSVVIGRDGRLSGPKLAAALAEGLRAAGVNVIDLGMVATPMTYFAAFELNTMSAVMVTGSHNPPDYNGLKMVIDGETLSGDTIQALRQRIEAGQIKDGAGGYRQHDIAAAYQARIVGDVKLARPMKIAVDCGNGVPGAFAPQLFTALGCTVDPLFCDVDGNF